jgi:hypothetical protein
VLGLLVLFGGEAAETNHNILDEKAQIALPSDSASAAAPE